MPASLAIGLGLVVSSVVLERVHGQAPDSSALVSAANERDDAPTKSHALALIEDLDRLFNENKLEEYLGTFSPLHRDFFQAEMAAPIRLLRAIEGLTARSRVQKFFRRGQVGIALVTTRYSWGTHRLELSNYTAFRREGNRTKALFAVEVDAGLAKMYPDQQNRFACPACNYQIGFDQNWLAVPVHENRSGCMESLWLISLEHDVYLEAAVHVGDEALAAEPALGRCLQTGRAKAKMKEIKPPEFEKWSPKFLQTIRPLPADISSIRCTRTCKAGAVAEMNLVTVGRLRYLIVVRGKPKDLVVNRASIDRVLNSFTLLDPTLSAVALAKRSTFEHTGRGVLDPSTNRYVNKKHDVSVAGPRRWTSRVRAGAWLFQLVFTSPMGTVLKIQALRPDGADWDTDSIDDLMLASVAGAGRVMQSPGKWSARDASGFRRREFRTRDEATGRANHWAQYAVRGNVLVVFDAYLASGADRDAVRSVFGSLGPAR